MSALDLTHSVEPIADVHALYRDDTTAIAEVTSRVTQDVAAMLIAAPDFPNPTKLPPLTPRAYRNFGHQVLFDYERLARIVWQVALNAREAASRTLRQRWGVLIAMASLIGLGAIATSNARVVAVTGVAIALGVLAYRKHITRASRMSEYEVRTRALESLLMKRGEDPPSAITVAPGTVGDGSLGDAELPVLTVHPKGRPFPGYGPLMAERLFVCRPKPNAAQASLRDLEYRIRAGLVAKVAEQPGVATRHGDVIVVNGASLSATSSWLGPDRAPLLWIPRSERHRVEDRDPAASVRVFHATQLVLPELTTAATIFTRVFATGTSIAFQIAITTLGPPAVKPEYFLKHLLRPTLHDREPFWRRFDLRRWSTGSSVAQGALEREYLPELWHHLALWPGRVLRPITNLREAKSLPLSTDYFDKPESMAFVQAVYDQVVRCTLDALDKGGFDVSDYRDSSGNILINAGKIEQLVIGETITMTTARPDDPQSPTEAEASV